MPRIKIAPEPLTTAHPQLVDALAQELQSNNKFGQPLVIEEPFGGTNDIRVTVFWDSFASVPDEERTKVILEAYERIDATAADHIAVALGLTFPEAEDEWLLPYEIVPNLRAGDPVSLQDCFATMLKLGASTLRDRHRPSLRFPKPDLAKRCVEELTRVLPASNGVWTILGHMRTSG
jgi:hypothetical protein